MEDLATLEISRAQVWQWIRHRTVLEEGMTVTSGFVKKIFEEELETILKEEQKESFIQAKVQAQELFLLNELPEFMEV